MKLHKGLVIWTSILVLASLVAGCAPLDTVLGETDDAAQVDRIDLDGTTWTLKEIDGEPVSTEGTKATLDFAEGQVSGVAFCNRFFGPYEQDENALSFGMLGSTMMACPAMDQESAYLRALETVTGYRTEGDNLVLTNTEDDAVLTFSPAEHATLENTAWHLTGYNTSNAISSLIPSSEITAALSDGQIKGSAGCNSYFASYTLDGAHIGVGPVANTEMFCGEPDGLMDQEMDYLAALAAADAYEIDRDTLTVLDSEGMRLLTFVAMGQ